MRTSLATPSPILSGEDFCEAVRSHVQDERLAMVPLVGAGISAQAGIPIGEDLQLYITYCVLKTLGLDPQQHSTSNQEYKPSRIFWHPVKDGWPRREGDWVERTHLGREALRSISELLNNGQNETINQYFRLCAEANGALEDWRTALLHLSRITLVPKDLNEIELEAHQKESQNRHRQPIGSTIIGHQNGHFVTTRGYIEARREYDVVYQQLPEVIKAARTYQADVSGIPPALNELMRSAKQVSDKRGEKSDKDYKDLINGQQKRLETVAFQQRIAEFVDALPYEGWREYRFVLADVDTQVVDSFFAALVSDTRPCMSHHMLVHLSGVLRSNAVLTLNFDDLLEKAFRLHNQDATVIEVHSSASVPPWSLCARGPHVVKMHGGKHGLRADYSLDNEPSTQDKNNFITYFTRPHQLHVASETSTLRADAHKVRAHLLVLGVSGRDTRIRHLIRHALTECPDLQCYWLCRSETDISTTKRYFGDLRGLKLVYAPHSAFLLLEVYQLISGVLPTGGVDLPLTWRNPIPPSNNKPTASNASLLPGKRAQQIFRDWQAMRSSDCSKLPLLSLAAQNPSVPETYNGVVSTGWSLFESLSERNNCIWLDVQSLSGPQDFARRFIEATHARLDQYPTKPNVSIESFPLPPDGSKAPKADLAAAGTLKCAMNDKMRDAFVREATSNMRRTSRPWIAFINTRSSPGYDADPFRRLFVGSEFDEEGGPTPTSFANYTSDRERLWSSCWETTTTPKDTWTQVVKPLVQFVNAIGKDFNHEGNACRFRVVLMTPDSVGECDIAQEIHHSFWIRLGVPKRRRRQSGDAWFVQRVSDAINWALEPTNEERQCRLSFLRLLTLFRTGRHRLAMNCKEVFGHAWDRKSGNEQARSYIEEFVGCGILKKQVGGYLWMHWKVREYLRFCLRFPGATNFKGRFDPVDSAKLHHRVAEWHMECFRASGDPIAAFDAVYHRCRRSLGGCGLKTQSAAESRSAMCQAIEHLESARSAILFRANQSDALQTLLKFLLFTCREFDQCKALAADQSYADRDEASRNVRMLLLLKIAAAVMSMTISRDAGLIETAVNVSDHLESWYKTWADDELVRRHATSWPDDFAFGIFICRFERALAYIAKRGFGKALDQLRNLLNEQRMLTTPDEVELYDLSEADWWNEAVKMGEESSGSAVPLQGQRFARRRFSVAILRRMAETHLLRAELFAQLHEMRRGKGAAHKTQQNLNIAFKYWNAACIIRRTVTKDTSGRLRVEEHRLSSVIAGAKALQSSLLGCPPGTWDEAVLHLKRAEAFEADLPEDELVQARIVLNLRKIFCATQALRAQSSYVFVRAELWNIRGPVREPSILREVAASIEFYIDEIQQCLNDLRRLFSEGRKTLWWWNTYLRYQMILIEHRQLLRCCRHMGRTASLEDAHEFDSDLDRAVAILSEATSRCEGDVYQLSRVIISFLLVVRITIILPKTRRGISIDGMKWEPMGPDRALVPLAQVRGLLAYTLAQCTRAGTTSDMDSEVVEYLELVVDEINATEGKLIALAGKSCITN